MRLITANHRLVYQDLTSPANVLRLKTRQDKHMHNLPLHRSQCCRHGTPLSYKPNKQTRRTRHEVTLQHNGKKTGEQELHPTGNHRCSPSHLRHHKKQQRRNALPKRKQQRLYPRTYLHAQLLCCRLVHIVRPVLLQKLPHVVAVAAADGVGFPGRVRAGRVRLGKTHKQVTGWIGDARLDKG